jgi:biopolymer transport protein ExbB/TolQ
MNAADVPLCWSRRDPEQRLGFRGGRYTRVNNLLSFLIAAVATVLFYVALIPAEGTRFAATFTERGPTPYCIVLLTFWALAILWLKSRKLAFQRRALKYQIVPESHDFVLSSATVDDVLHNMYATVDDPRYFVLFNRITIALSNLRNLGRVSDVDDILRSQASHEESSMETSYLVVQGFVWAIPVLGFIGTVLGLSEAIGGFGNVLGSSTDISELSSALRVVTAGLNTAFETTLVALVAALAIHMMLTFLKKSEEEFMDACSDYCVRHVVGRLRVMPFEAATD